MRRALFYLFCISSACALNPLNPCPPILQRFLPSSFSGSFYVSKLGNDSWTGTLPTPSPSGDDGPFLTPYAAEAAVLSLPRPLTSDVNVFLRTGVYFLNSTLSLGPGSGGDGPDARVRWATYPTDTPGSAVLSGGVPVTGWTPSGMPGIWMAPLPVEAPARSRGLFVNDQRRWPARVPAAAGPLRSDWASDASSLHFVSSLNGCGLPPAPCWGGNCSQASNAGNNFGFVFNASDDRSPKQGWSDVSGVDVLVFGAWTAAWSSVRAVFDENSTLLVNYPLSTARPGAWTCAGGKRYILFNVREALVPGSGEYYVNDGERKIYYAPTVEEGGDPTSLSIVTPVLDTVMSVEGDDCGGPVGFLELNNLTISHATDGGFSLRAQAYQSTVGALRFSSSMDCTVSGVVVRATDGSGIYLAEDLMRITINSSRVESVGGDGIGCAVNSDSSADPINITVTNSVVDGVGFVFYNQPGGMRLKGSVDSTFLVENNHVRDSSYAGIMVSWQQGTTIPSTPVQWRFIVRGNLVEDCGNSLLSDFGGIYISSSGEQCQATESCFIPTLVEGNLVRNIRGYDYGGEGIYTDENVAGVYITGNAAGNVSGAGLYLHCGLNQSVVNNIFWGSRQPSGTHFSESNPGGLMGTCNTGGVEPQWTNISALLLKNVFELTEEGSQLFNPGNILGAEVFDSNVYWTSAGSPDALRWLGNESNSPMRTWQQWNSGGQDLGGAVGDPLISDPTSNDFRLLPGSPALARGFQQLFPNGPPGPRVSR